MSTYEWMREEEEEAAGFRNFSIGSRTTHHKEERNVLGLYRRIVSFGPTPRRQRGDHSWRKRPHP